MWSICDALRVAGGGGGSAICYELVVHTLKRRPFISRDACHGISAVMNCHPDGRIQPEEGSAVLLSHIINFSHEFV